MSTDDPFDIKDFLPYMLNQAAEASSLGFQRHYRDRYGMLRTEWRVVFHLGRYGPLTAKDICVRANLHKTKVSRAVAALQAKRYLTRATDPADRRNEYLSLTPQGSAVFRDLIDEAQRFDAAMAAQFSAEDVAVLRKCLAQIAKP